MVQNTSHAVMAQRVEAKDSLDDFPTPPWATRALMQHVIGPPAALADLNCLEPCCGQGHMAKVLSDCFRAVWASDVHPYGYGAVRDFRSYSLTSLPTAIDWVISNPPFRLAEEFISTGLAIARVGVAALVRTTFIESVGRYEALFSKTPPAVFAQFTERVPMLRGRLERNASTATGYCWLVWYKQGGHVPRLAWIPPCRKGLECATDYGPVEGYDGSRWQRQGAH